jgi:hypothetical protein
VGVVVRVAVGVTVELLAGLLLGGNPLLDPEEEGGVLGVAGLSVVPGSLLCARLGRSD